MRLADIPRLPPKLLIYGPPGTGKTVFAMTLGKGTQVFDLEEGLLSAVTLQDAHTAARHEVDVVPIKDTDPMKADGFRIFKQEINKVSKLCVTKQYPFKALIIDTLTSLANMAIRYVMGNSGRLGTPPEIQHWGLAFTELDNVYTTIKTLPIVVVLTAHDQTKTIDNMDKVELSIPGKNQPGRVGARFDEFLYSRVMNRPQGKREFVLQSLPTQSVAARSRGQLPDMFSMNDGMVKLLSQIGFDWENFKAPSEGDK
jgi:hypothetical protein